MSFVINLLLFNFSVFFIFFLPGKLVFHLLQLKLSRLETTIISLMTGLLLFTFLSYLLGFLGGRFLMPMIILGIDLVAILAFWQGRKNFCRNLNLSVKRAPWVLILLIFLGVSLQGSIVFFSGLENRHGLSFRGEIHDAFWHLALIGELKNHFPPEHPGFAGQRLTNYHFLYDLTLAGFSSLTGLPPLDLYFRFFPVLISGLLGLTTFIAARAFFKSDSVANLAVFLTYFCGNFGYFLPLFKGLGTYWSGFTFWINQTHSALYNPQFALSLPIFLAGFFLFLKYPQKIHYPLLIMISLTWGMLIGFKSYGGVIVLTALFLVSLIEAVFYKKARLLFLFGGSLAIALVVFLPNWRPTENFFVFAPGWFLRAMVENPDRLNISQWILQENTYLSLGDSLGLFRLRIKEFLIFLVGNLGIRILGLVGLFLLVWKKEKTSLEKLFLIIAALIAFFFPLFFIQKGSVANTIQFAFYSLVIINFFTAKFINRLIQKKKGLKRKAIFALIFLLAFPSSLKMFLEAIRPGSPFLLPNQELAALGFLKRETDPNSIILLYPSGKNLSLMYVSALSGRRTYFSDIGPAEITNQKYQERVELMEEFFTTNNLEFQNEFLKQNKITHIYLLPGEGGVVQEEELPISLAFSNEEAWVYQVD